MKLERVCDHTFISSFLDSSSIVVDLGANTGAFSLGIRKAYGCSILATEPVPALFGGLPKVEGIRWLPYAISAKSGRVILHVNPKACATIERPLVEEGAETVEVPALSLDDLVRDHLSGGHIIDLVKVDIEGAEIPMLNSISHSLFSRIKMLTVEFHEFLDPSLAEPVRQTIANVVGNGFFAISWSRRNTDILFVNEELTSLTALDKSELWSKKYAWGLKRVASRALSRVSFSHANRGR